jgi:hypothetical protein
MDEAKAQLELRRKNISPSWLTLTRKLAAADCTKAPAPADLVQMDSHGPTYKKHHQSSRLPGGSSPSATPWRDDLDPAQRSHPHDRTRPNLI